MAAAPPGRQIIDELATQVKQSFEQFIEQFHKQIDGAAVAFTYVEDIARMADNKSSSERTTLFVNYTDVSKWDFDLAQTILTDYYRLEPYLAQAFQNYVKKKHPEWAAKGRAQEDNKTEREVKQLFVAFHSFPNTEGLRSLKTKRVGQLMAVSGTVTRSSQVRPELILGTFTCGLCSAEVKDVQQQFKYTEPLTCPNGTCENRSNWHLDTSKSTFVDWQVLRVQETTTDIPAGSMPRSMKIVLRNDIVELAKPGDKCVFTGTLIVVPDVAQLTRSGGGRGRGGGGAAGGGRGGGRGGNLRGAGDNQGISGLKELGVRDLTYKLCFLASSVRHTHSSFGVVQPRDDTSNGKEKEIDIEEEFTLAERRRIIDMAALPNLYTRMVKSIAPTIFGHEEIKRGVLLMLFGGVHKETRDRTMLRGDINVCVVGDPSTSKSQFLKYVCQFLPRAIYTSGKASSAAGLTASVVRDPETGEFTIEAGALMLADNGICCIDEFDKMDLKDQVAIHEAMEQQTISISKAGIQATLNARTSVLAAANPIHGRYDKGKTLKQNVDISAPILSRFDLFFVVLDECDGIVDQLIAQHIVKLHQNKEAAVTSEFSLRDLQIYIKFARMLKPKLSKRAAEYLALYYVDLREEDATGSARTAYRITVRQLESMIRLAEARARLELQDIVKVSHVKEAARLLKMSIVHVETGDVTLGRDDHDDNYDDYKRGDGGDDDDDDNGADGIAARSRRAKQEMIKSAARKRGLDPNSITAKKPGSAPAAAAAGESKDEDKDDYGAAAAAAGASDEAVKITFDEYRRISLVLVLHLRSVEESSRDGRGMEQRALVEWWLQKREKRDAIEDETRLRQELVKITKLIENLVDNDNVLIVQTPADHISRRVLMVHPNYIPESGPRDESGGRQHTRDHMEPDHHNDAIVRRARKERSEAAATAELDIRDDDVQEEDEKAVTSEEEDNEEDDNEGDDNNDDGGAEAAADNDDDEPVGQPSPKKRTALKRKKDTNDDTDDVVAENKSSEKKSRASSAAAVTPAAATPVKAKVVAKKAAKKAAVVEEDDEEKAMDEEEDTQVLSSQGRSSSSSSVSKVTKTSSTGSKAAATAKEAVVTTPKKKAAKKAAAAATASPSSSSSTRSTRSKARK